MTTTPKPPDVRLPSSVPTSGEKSKIRLPVDNPDAARQFVDRYPDITYDYFLKRLKSAIANGWDEVFLFELGDSGKYVTFKKEDYYSVLSMLKEYYCSPKTQAYELAAICQNLMDKICVDRVINDLDNPEGK